MTFHRLALPVLALALGTSGMLMAKSGLPQGNPVQDEGRSHDQDRGGWDAPPGELREVQRRGFHDGLDAGKEDAEHHHHNIEKSRLYRHPPVQSGERDGYRDGFRRGYEAAISHYGGDHDRDHDRQ
jgi:hypothetical protein